ncbi:aldehyde dehydrogenase family protein [Peribacillus cavernae]|uniref:Aldehyde dehydrogenase n=1 Tax=Peribacillus cavernae TaxID=1674310 RepID=A0A3S0W464_9BACI|nr:aldehyde dehydrogenase family protein [Peribacillus cavernae]MDQ0220599.1 aldehyde dehydrogenase (NAD+) [Peribacillus cavernae]RUQ27342.1 aldehyde dehydrogenase family protein [Peribacillus cavernae]
MADHDHFYPKSLLERQREDFLTSSIPSIDARKKTLLRMKKMLLEQEADFMQSLLLDMGRPAFEAFSFEIAVLLNEIDYVVKHLEKWIKSTRSRHLKFGYVETIDKIRNPYGCVLIISPWNYPLQLALMPAISALASGNRCVIKPSEHAPATSELLKKLISQTFPPEQLAVVTGDVQTAKILTSLPFDLIFFTGSEQVGKNVAQQAAKQLTPMILELGGKNPCIIDETGFSKAAIQEVVWGKFLNAGQTCIAPDTLYVHQSIYEKTLSEISTTLSSFYGDQPENSDDYGRICHVKNFEKIINFMGQGDVWHGGTHDAENLFIAPTVVTDIKPGSAILQEEIFGPVLPVIPYADLETLLSKHVIQRDALTAYLFSENKKHIRLFKHHMLSTTVSVNQVIHHAANPHVPFGGIGRSGHGSYHGKAGFQSCSYEKTAYQAHHYKNVQDKFPPYTDKDMDVVKKFRKWLL